MLAYSATQDIHFVLNIRLLQVLNHNNYIGSFSLKFDHSHISYERAALLRAIDDGLMPNEVTQILASRWVAEAFPVRWGESPEAYAYCSVSEMFTAYLQ